MVQGFLCQGVAIVIHVHSENALFLLKIFFSTFRYRFRQTQFIVVLINELSIKIVNFMTSGAGFFVLGLCHINHTAKMHYFFKKSFILPCSMIQTKLVYICDEQGRIDQNCEFHDHWNRGLAIYSKSYSICLPLNIQPIDCYCIKGL